MTLLQEIPISTATMMCPRTILAQLVADPPDLTVIVVYTGTAVIRYDKAIRAVACPTLRRWVADIFTAQGGAPIQAAGLLHCGVGLICTSRTVRFAITHFTHWYTCSRAWASPLTRVTVARVTITSTLIAEIPTVVELVTHPLLRNTTAAGTCELTATAALVHTALLITVIPTVVPVVAHKGMWNTVAIRTLILVDGTVLSCAVGFI